MDAKGDDLNKAITFFMMVATAPSPEAVAERTIDICGSSRSDAITTIENAARVLNGRGYDVAKLQMAAEVIKNDYQR